MIPRHLPPVRFIKFWHLAALGIALSRRLHYNPLFVMQCKGRSGCRLPDQIAFIFHWSHATMTEKHSGTTQSVPYLQIQGLVKTFGDQYAVDHVDLSINKHEIFALLGSSGSGKSTLLLAAG